MVSTSLVYGRANSKGSESLCSLQEEFFSRIAPGIQMWQPFEFLPGVCFFVKDDRGRMISANAPLLERLGARDVADIVGTSDYDLFARRTADHFVQSDQRILQTGQPLIQLVEAWRNEQLVVTSKFPVRDAGGGVFGIIGVFQVYEKTPQTVLLDAELHQAVEYMRSHLHEQITVEELADRAFLSIRQLRRKIRHAFGMTVQEFLVKVRVQAASEALVKTGDSIAEIANRFGFYDQSALTHQFRRQFGTTPLKFRQQAAQSANPSSQTHAH